MLAELARLPGQVERINGDAVTAEPGAGVKGHEAERLRFRSLDDFPDVDVHGAVNELELVHEGDVHGAEDVFQQLGCLGHAAGADGHQLLDGDAVEGDCLVQTGRGQAADDLGDGGDLAVRIAGILALGREGEVEIGSRDKAGAFFQDSAEFAIGGTGIGGGFQDDERALLQVRGEGAAGIEHVAEVRLAEVVERRGDAEDDGIHLGDAGEIGGGLEISGGEAGGDLRGGHMLDVALAGVDRVGLAGVDIEAEDGGSGTGKLQGKRKTDVSEADDGDILHEAAQCMPRGAVRWVGKNHPASSR